MNPLLASTLAGSLCLAPALAGTVVPEITMAAATSSTSDGFANARRPISNPTLFDLALPTTNIHPLIMFHQLPDFVQTTAGLVPMGGDVQVYAVQFEIALTDRLSFVANKDGYVDINPDTKPLWSDQSGFANLGAGFKYAFILDPASGTALSGTMTFEIPTGNHDVFQGEGNGGVNLILNGLKLMGDWQFAGSAGVQIPFSDQQATSSFVSAHASYEVCKYFIPLIELNWFHVLDTGDGRPNFFSQAGGGVPVIAQFEGGDLLNFGAGNAFANRDFVTAAIGFRSRLMDGVDAGVAYELPLTSKENGIMKDRITVDVVWKF